MANPYADWAHARVARLLADGPALRVVAVVVTSLDGICAVDGHSAALSSVPDRALVGAWREAADALLVGPSTLSAEVYGGGLFPPSARGRRRARGLTATTPVVTIDRSGTLDLDRALRAKEPLELYVYVPVGGARQDSRATWIESADMSLSAVIADAQMRFHAELVVAEPGPRLFASLERERVVSDLSLTITPRIVGHGSPLWPNPQPAARHRSAGTSGTETYPTKALCTHRYFAQFHTITAETIDSVMFVHLSAPRPAEPPRR